MPTTLALAHLPPSYKLHIALFDSVTNAAHLHSQLLAKNSDYEYAFIDPSILVSQLQPLSAAFRALNDLLDPSITDSYRRFGISPTSTAVLVIKIMDTASQTYSETDTLSHLTSIIEGTEIPFDTEHIRKFTDLAKVKKYYKLKDLGYLDALYKRKGRDVRQKTEEEEWADLEVAVLGQMALRSLV
ncbi:hypothetical protein H072_3530 [Dactylellina haptotyla CBS 200.50]|uniref:EKC/KEOPS complex subunit CGI121 n=1 Tax=Dactylellina haptotyla (strain CBS 200.50) TaxID=1284197 RepID=S8AN06_DACHA|nr:hypothetical protein H072_3530 [Dactylellina haptotyla CBS 200.50]